MNDIDLRRLASGVPGPNIIGATGGSGTRVVARIVRRGGMFIGTNLNASEDALDFGWYSDRWISVFMANRTSALSAAIRAKMIQDLKLVLRNHLVPLDPRTPAWGWKEPRSIFLLPFFNSQFPLLKFLHVTRDGRDMAYSVNQNQLRKHGGSLLEPIEVEANQPVSSIALWSRLNLLAADYGEAVLRTRYLHIRFEDLCARPLPTIVRIFAFLELRGDVEEIAAQEVRPPDSLGRWRAQDPETVAELHRVGGGALARFGYRPIPE